MKIAFGQSLLTVYSFFRLGAKLRSPSTGIILNDEMDDFATSHIVNTFGIAPSAVNRIAPGKRPMSSMCPSIILDNNKNVLLLIGAAGGSKITTSTAYVSIASSRS